MPGASTEHRSGGILLAGLLAVAGCGGDGATGTCTPHAATRLPLSTAVYDTAITSATRYFRVPVTAGTLHSVALVGMPVSPVSLKVYADPCLEQSLASGLGAVSPIEVKVVPTDSALWFELTPETGASLPSHRVIVVSPVPSGLDPQAEVAVLAAETPTVGQASTRGTSTYRTPGLAAGVPYTISLTAMSEDAVLHVFQDSTYTWELDCTLTAVRSLNAPQECTLTPTGTTAWFSVASGPLNRAGARYVLLVSRF